MALSDTLQGNWAWSASRHEPQAKPTDHQKPEKIPEKIAPSKTNFSKNYRRKNRAKICMFQPVQNNGNGSIPNASVTNGNKSLHPPPP